MKISSFAVFFNWQRPAELRELKHELPSDRLTEKGHLGRLQPHETLPFHFAVGAGSY